jgi:hypothetical protein
MTSSSGGKRKLDDVEGPSHAERSTNMTLREMVNKLKDELGIDASNLKEAVHEAADNLGVQKEDKTLLELARACCEELG